MVTNKSGRIQDASDQWSNAARANVRSTLRAKIIVAVIVAAGLIVVGIAVANAQTGGGHLRAPVVSRNGSRFLAPPIEATGVSCETLGNVVCVAPPTPPADCGGILNTVCPPIDPTEIPYEPTPIP